MLQNFILRRLRLRLSIAPSGLQFSRMIRTPVFWFTSCGVGSKLIHFGKLRDLTVAEYQLIQLRPLLYGCTTLP